MLVISFELRIEPDLKPASHHNRIYLTNLFYRAKPFLQVLIFGAIYLTVKSTFSEKMNLSR